MPIPYRFANRAELLDALRQYPWEAWFQLERWRERSSSLEQIVERSVGSTTFRAFHHMRQPPSRTFRSWAVEALDEKRLRDLQSVASQSQYTDWLYRLSNDLRRYWRRRMHADIPFGPSLKLPNLVAKRLGLYREITKQCFETFVWFLEVPLDSYTILAVANCVESFPDADAIGRIPAAATMKFVSGLRIYEAFQRGIRELAKDAGVPPITLDCVAWDAGHDTKSLVGVATAAS